MLHCLATVLLALSVPVATLAEEAQVGAQSSEAVATTLDQSQLEPWAFALDVSATDALAVTVGRDLLTAFRGTWRGRRRVSRKRGPRRSNTTARRRAAVSRRRRSVNKKPSKKQPQRKRSPRSRSAPKKKPSSSKTSSSKQPKQDETPMKEEKKQSSNDNKKQSVSGGAKTKDGKWVVCVAKGDDMKTFGVVESGWSACYIRVTKSGKCYLHDRCGGFDMFWSVNAGDSHEPEMAFAAKQMIRTGNNGIASQFLKQLRDVAKVRDLDFTPANKKLAENKVRRENTLLANKACEKIISVQTC